MALWLNQILPWDASFCVTCFLSRVVHFSFIWVYCDCDAFICLLQQVTCVLWILVFINLSKKKVHVGYWMRLDKNYLLETSYILLDVHILLAYTLGVIISDDINIRPPYDLDLSTLDDRGNALNCTTFFYYSFTSCLTWLISSVLLYRKIVLWTTFLRWEICNGEKLSNCVSGDLH